MFVASHLLGDFLLQTDWQATSKAAGLRRHAGAARRALLAHVTTYTLAFVPALIWLAEARGASVTWVALLIAGPHLLQDDGRLIGWWMTRVKHVDADTQPILAMAVDQTFTSSAAGARRRNERLVNRAASVTILGRLAGNFGACSIR